MARRARGTLPWGSSCLPPFAFLYPWPTFTEYLALLFPGIGSSQSPRFRQGGHCQNALRVREDPSWFVHSKSGAVFMYLFLKSKWALDICKTPVPAKVNNILEPTACSSKRCVGTEERRSQSLWRGAKMRFVTTWFRGWKHIPCNHGAFVLLSF